MSVQLVSTVTDEEYTVYILTTIDPNLRYVIGRDGHLDQSQTWDMDSTDLRISAGWFPFAQGNGRVWLCCVSLLGYDFNDKRRQCVLLQLHLVGKEWTCWKKALPERKSVVTLFKCFNAHQTQSLLLTFFETQHPFMPVTIHLRVLSNTFSN